MHVCAHTCVRVHVSMYMCVPACVRAHALCVHVHCVCVPFGSLGELQPVAPVEPLTKKGTKAGLPSTLTLER